MTSKTKVYLFPLSSNTGLVISPCHFDRGAAEVNMARKINQAGIFEVEGGGGGERRIPTTNRLIRSRSCSNYAMRNWMMSGGWSQSFKQLLFAWNCGCSRSGPNYENVLFWPTPLLSENLRQAYYYLGLVNIDCHISLAILTSACDLGQYAYAQEILADIGLGWKPAARLWNVCGQIGV